MRALICGAGIAGLTLTRRLGAMSWDVDLVERALSLRDEGYLIDVCLARPRRLR
jgi:2-polyprenyl-6-methoxyphenol hydroxylase-like FAD-dependent oxidoreductase